jgi:hypothetical protein
MPGSHRQARCTHGSLFLCPVLVFLKGSSQALCLGASVKWEGSAGHCPFVVLLLGIRFQERGTGVLLTPCVDYPTEDRASSCWCLLESVIRRLPDSLSCMEESMAGHVGANEVY